MSEQPLIWIEHNWAQFWIFFLSLGTFLIMLMHITMKLYDFMQIRLQQRFRERQELEIERNKLHKQMAEIEQHFRNGNHASIPEQAETIRVADTEIQELREEIKRLKREEIKQLKEKIAPVKEPEITQLEPLESEEELIKEHMKVYHKEEPKSELNTPVKVYPQDEPQYTPQKMENQKYPDMQSQEPRKEPKKKLPQKVKDELDKY